MTILVIFGYSHKFDNAPHGKQVGGNNGDCIYFADDRPYVETEKSFLSPPAVADKPRILVIQHKGGSGNHNSQLKWLEAKNYNPANVENISQIPGTEPFDTIKRLLNPNQDQDQVVAHQDQVSSFVQQYGNRAILQYMDNCAAWNALYLISKLPLHEDKMNDYRRMLPHNVSEKLRKLASNQWLPTLEKEATAYC